MNYKNLLLILLFLTSCTVQSTQYSENIFSNRGFVLLYDESLIEKVLENESSKTVSNIFRYLDTNDQATIIGMFSKDKQNEILKLIEVDDKDEVEEIIKDWCKNDNEKKSVLLRYFNPIGAHASGLIGEDPVETPNNLMPYITQVASGRLDKLKIYGDDYETNDGTGVRDYIHVVDLAKGHLAAINFLEKCKDVEIFNLGTGLGHSVKEVLNSFFLINPVSTIIQIRFFWIALFINNATTLLSTPPDNAHITLSFFTVFFISFINLFFWDVALHFFFILQIGNKKFLNSCFPLSV